MKAINSDTHLVKKDVIYKLTKREVEIINDQSDNGRMTSEEIQDTRNYLLYTALDLKYGEALSDNEKKKLVSEMIGMSYFQYSDLLFNLKKKFKDANKRVFNPSRTTRGKLQLSLEQDRNRQDWEARTGMQISPEDYAKSLKNKKDTERKKAVFSGKSGKDVQQMSQALAEYKKHVISSAAILPLSPGEGHPDDEAIFLGGYPLLLENELIPADENGVAMKLVCAVNLNLLGEKISNAAVPHSGFLCFYLAAEGYEFFTPDKTPFEVRYYESDKGLDRRKEDSDSSYGLIRCNLRSCETIPMSPWPAAEQIEKEAKELFQLLQDYRETFELQGSSLFMGYTNNVELAYLNEGGQNVIDELDNFLPLLHLKSITPAKVGHSMVFGDAGAIGFFIRKYDWVNGNFSNIAFGYYN